MRVDTFDFTLPPGAIATCPAEPRDSARLLYVPSASTNFTDHTVRDLPSLLKPGDLLVLNNTEVIPARLHGSRGKAGVAVTLHRELPSNNNAETRWQVFAKPAKKLREGDIFIIAPDFSATVITAPQDGIVTLCFPYSQNVFYAKLGEFGETPLPPYIVSKRAVEEEDLNDYQTIYAEEKGAVAAPTAGLHFTDRLFRTLENAGIQKTFVTLHVGAGTFLPVKVEDTRDHNMHAEWFRISPETANTINRAKAEGGRVVAVGTTSLRTLEAAANNDGIVSPTTQETSIFITPGYHFKLVDVLLTNFHLPRSTLFMLVSAFSGLERMHAAYRHAIDEGYRFYSYGDATLLECNQ